MSSPPRFRDAEFDSTTHDEVNLVALPGGATAAPMPSSAGSGIVDEQWVKMIEQSASDLINTGRAGEALKILTDALRKKEHSDLWNDWACAAFACGNVALAESGYHRALQLHPANRQAAVNLVALRALEHGQMTMSGRRPTISLVVNTWNEERNLPALLDSCRTADEMVIADMASTDHTTEIARQKGARVINLPFPGGVCCEPGRQMAVDAATSDWILLLDADERLSFPGLERLRLILATAPPNIAAYSLVCQTFLGPTRIYATGWETQREWHIRVFRRGRVRWPDKIHSVPQIDGQIVSIPEDTLWLNHYKFVDIFHALEKSNRYSSVEADELRRLGKDVSIMQGLSEGLSELVRRYSPEQDGALSFALAFGALVTRLFAHAKASEASSWPQEQIPSKLALARAVQAFAKKVVTEMVTTRPAGVSAARSGIAGNSRKQCVTAKHEDFGY